MAAWDSCYLVLDCFVLQEFLFWQGFGKKDPHCKPWNEVFFAEEIQEPLPAKSANCIPGNSPKEIQRRVLLDAMNRIHI
jgi:hypothetical protein